MTPSPAAEKSRSRAALTFLHGSEASTILQRAAKAAAMPVSVRFMSRDNEGPKIAGHGQCAMCRYVASSPGGVQACRDSRLPWSAMAVTQERPIPFLCHLGFACLSIPVLPEARSDEETGFVMTLGPCCPAEAAETFELDALAGLAELGIECGGSLPVPLDDVRAVPMDALHAVAEWTVEAVENLWEGFLAAEIADMAEGQEGETASAYGGRHGVRSSMGSPAPSDPYGAASMAAALLGGDFGTTRSLVRAALAEAPAGRRHTLAAKRARALTVAAATIETITGFSDDAAPYWERFPHFLDELGRTRNNAQIASAVMSLLGFVKRAAGRGGVDDGSLDDLNEIVLSRLTEGISLGEVAKTLGEHPTAITHRLQRKLGMSFSQYVGRLRVDRAKDLLRRTKLGVREIARRVGVDDPSNLGKLFRKFAGMSPSKYRSQFGECR